VLVHATCDHCRILAGECVAIAVTAFAVRVMSIGPDSDIRVAVVVIVVGRVIVSVVVGVYAGDICGVIRSGVIHVATAVFVYVTVADWWHASVGYVASCDVRCADSCCCRRRERMVLRVLLRMLVLSLLK